MPDCYFSFTETLQDKKRQIVSTFSTEFSGGTDSNPGYALLTTRFINSVMIPLLHVFYKLAFLSQRQMLIICSLTVL